jgi:hypothetical protein
MTDPCSDPLFQLNAVLWMLQPHPAHSTAVNAVLYRSGYAVRSIGQTLTADPGLERSLATKLELRGAPRPDVLASSAADDPWPIFECKKSSFGPESSTSAQALKVLVRGSDLSLAVGAPAGHPVSGCAVFVTRDDQARALQDTIDQLRAAAEQAGVPAAPAATLSLRQESGVGLLARIAAGVFPGSGGIALADDVVVVPAAGAEEAARPLYLIPFDPSVEQEEAERQLCLRILLARGQAHAASVLGRGPDQGTAVLEASDLIQAATYGLAKYWRDSSARDRAGQQILRFVKDALTTLRGAKAPMVTMTRGGNRLEVVIQSAEHQLECAEAVMAYPLPDEPEFAHFAQDELPFTGG